MTRCPLADGRALDLDVREAARPLLAAAVLGRRLTRREIASAVDHALTAAGAPERGLVGLTLADDQTIGELNAAHMGKTGPTDVLSFPLLGPDAYPAHEDSAVPMGAAAIAAVAFALPPRSRPLLGEIVVSVERAVAQAREGRGGQAGDRRWDPADEILLLVTHGTLHLCGWDHAEPIEEAAMRRLERELLGLD
jgi:probable rRNA maturation factor